LSNKYKIISFDADDTLWVNEPYYRQTESEFCHILRDYLPENIINKELYKTEISNLELYGYGAKGFVLSLLETALKITENKIDPQKILQIINLGKDLLNRPIELLEGVEDCLDYLKHKNYKLIVATKGDLLDQERKLKRSSLSSYFHHIEVMSDKTQLQYENLVSHLDIKASEFLMIGNSLKSDILPVLKIGGSAIYIPYHTTWQHETVEEILFEVSEFITLDAISGLKNIL
jgi:putative hydrolase of the HAD superfamily